MNKILEILQKNYKKTAFVLGGISALAFPPTYMFVLYILSFMMALRLLDDMRGYKKVCLFGYWFGFSHFVVGLYWIANALLVDFVSYGWLYPITLLCIGVFFGLFVIPSFAVFHLLKNQNNWIKIIAFSYVWVLSEWVRSFLFTGFPWNLLGTIFAANEVFIQTASIWGTYGLSFIALIIAGCFYLITKREKICAICVLVFIFSFLTGFGLWRTSGYEDVKSDTRIRLVQPSIAQSMKWDPDELENNFFEYVELSRKDGLEGVDFVVWGETALPFDIKYRYEYQEYLKQAVPDNGYLLTGVVRFEEFYGRYKQYNSMYVVNKNAEVEDVYDKNHLVPFGEYIPLRKYLPDWIKPVTNSVADFATSEKLKNIKLKNQPAFGALICYEIIFPDNVINRKSKPQWLAVLTNDGWYGKSSGPYQHLVAARMRAVEEGISVVRSANSGISAVISPYGKVLKQIDLHEKGYVDVDLPEKSEVDTIYSHIGGKSVIFILSLMMFVLVCVVVFIEKNKTAFDNKAIK